MLKSMKSLKNQSGQIIVLVLLILFLGLTVALSVVSRTLSDLKQTTVTDESSRAFSAAEAGIEEALRTGIGAPAPVDLGNKANYQVEITSASGVAEYAFPQKVAHDDTQQIWLAAHDDSGNVVESAFADLGDKIYVEWGDSGDSEAGNTAIEISLIYKDGGDDYKMEKWAVDPKTRSNFETAVACPIAGSGDNCKIGAGIYTFKYSKELDIASFRGGAKIPMALRLRPLYNETPQPLGVKFLEAGKSFPAQGREIISTGTSGTVTRKVKVFKSYASLPAIFDYVLFSNSDITK